MRNFLAFLSLWMMVSCHTHSHDTEKQSKTVLQDSTETSHFTLVFASCNHQDKPQPLWKPILENHPDVFVLLGDNIYADTNDMGKMKADYGKVLNNPDYRALMQETPIMGTWDDHDYGKNDAGVEWEMKREAQQLFWDFMQLPKDDPLRKQEGIYHSKLITTPKGAIKFIFLDTRYFRDPLQKNEGTGGPYQPWSEDYEGTLLGAAQWKWLEQELQDTTADFTIIGSSIQLLSNQHGWEKWSNFPKETQRLKELIAKTNSNVIVLSGDRHMAEISVEEVPGMDYPLVDFTSSGLTHTWLDGPTEGNPFRVSNVVKKLNFGVLQFDFDTHTVVFQIRGKDDFLFDTFTQQFPKP